jgi:hypothetical protein
MSRVRPSFVVALVVAAVGAGAALVVPPTLARLDASRHEHAVDQARAVPAPDGVTTATDCHGETVVACWESDRPVDALVADLLVSTQGLSDDGPVEQDCDPAPAGRAEPAHACLLAIRDGSHGVFVFVYARVAQDDDGGMVVTGSTVSVTAT